MKTAEEIKKLFGSKVKYDPHGQMIFAVNDKGETQLILDVRAWGRLQNEFKTQEEASKFQDEMGEFFASCIQSALNATS